MRPKGIGVPATWQGALDSAAVAEGSIDAADDPATLEVFERRASSSTSQEGCTRKDFKDFRKKENRK